MPYYQVESDRHHPNLFGVLVGESAKGRKGTALTRIRAVVSIADETWSSERFKGGLSSGEGLIHEVRDPVQKWDAKEKHYETVDPGASDKRLMVVEPEFAGVLAVAERPGNTISPLIRRAWDGDKLETLTRSIAVMRDRRSHFDDRPHHRRRTAHAHHSHRRRERVCKSVSVRAG